MIEHGCEGCKHDNKREDEYPCNRCKYNAEDMYEPVQKQTNGDRIRAMSDEELAEFLAERATSTVCKICAFNFTGKCRYDEEGQDVGSMENCIDGIKERLQQEVEG